jgi:hypothetical protein
MGGILLEAAGGAIAHGGADQGGPIMNRTDQIKAAIKIIGPVDHKACEKLIEKALNFIAMDAADHQHEKDVSSKESRKALTAYHAALDRARVAHQKLPAGMKQALEKMGRLKEAQPKIEDLIADCAWLLELSGLPKSPPVDFAKISAAAWSANVLQLLDMKTSATRGGKWVKLAAVLCGDPSGDLLHHCRQWKAATDLD